MRRERNLLSYQCEQQTICGPRPNPACTTSATSAVSPIQVNCAGRCCDGSCDGRWPTQGHPIDRQQRSPLFLRLRRTLAMKQASSWLAQRTIAVRRDTSGAEHRGFTVELVSGIEQLSTRQFVVTPGLRCVCPSLTRTRTRLRCIALSPLPHAVVRRPSLAEGFRVQRPDGRLHRPNRSP